MSWETLGIFRVTQHPIFTPVVEGRLFRVRSLEAQEFQILIRQAQVILDQVEVWQPQRLTLGPAFLVMLLPKPDFFEHRRLSVQLAEITRSSTPRNILIEANPLYV